MIEKIRLVEFRNFKDVVVSFSPSVNVFVGDNGQGKSNILEAISVLSTGESFRFAKNENLIKFGSQNSFLQAKNSNNDLAYEVNCEILKSKKNISINKKRTTQSELLSKFPIVLFSPESLSAIKEGGDLRRQLLDELIVSIKPINSNLIAEFKKAHKTRNKILKNFSEGITHRPETEALLESIFPTYFDLSLRLTVQRIQALKDIHLEFNRAMQRISASHVDISVEYVVSDQECLKREVDFISEILKKRFKDLHDAELASGASLVGPHKHDVVFLYGGNDSRFYCSQGQQRALILSFKMAQIMYHKQTHGTYPILLLDDVLSELDSSKRSSLIQFLSEVDTQIFITTTDFELPSSLGSEDCAVLKIREGTIEGAQAGIT